MKLRVEPAHMELTASGRLAGVPEGGPAATKSDAAARWSAQRTCSAACSLATTYVAGSIQRDRAQFCMGLCTVSLVVSFAALLIGAIGLTCVGSETLARASASTPPPPPTTAPPSFTALPKTTLDRTTCC